MVSAHDVAAYILSKRGSMSTMKLQKLVYYSQAWHLVWAEEPLFGEQIEAWANGPVAPDLFREHKGRFSVATWPKGDPANLDKAQAGTVDAVLGTYGPLTGRKLSYLTHSEDPWLNARKGYGPTDLCHVEITPDVMRDYYVYVADNEGATAVEDFDWGEMADAPGTGDA